MRSGLLTLSALVVVSGLLVIGGAAQLCTPATCPPDMPVYVYFEYSNCTGERTYSYALTADGTGCHPSGDDGGYLVIVNDDGVVWYNPINRECDFSRPNATYQRYEEKFGKCNAGSVAKRDSATFANSALHANRDALASMFSASMLLPYANATFDAPQSFDLSNPNNLTNLFELLPTDCSGPNNCTNDDGTPYVMYRTYYSEPGNCSTGTSSMGFKDLTNGQCLWYPYYAYTKFTCGDDIHTYATRYYTDPECTNEFASDEYRQTCLSTESDTAFFCNPGATPSPSTSTPTPPSSSASTLGFIPFLVVIISAVFFG